MKSKKEFVGQEKDLDGAGACRGQEDGGVDCWKEILNN